MLKNPKEIGIKPTIIASEGGAGYFPENTSYAVKNSLAQGADGIELDLHLTSDKRFVAHHDYRLNPALCRDRNGNWITAPGPIIKQSTYANLQQFNVGGVDPESPLGKRYPSRASIDHECIATFEDVDLAFQNDAKRSERNVEFWLEAKTDPYNLDLTTDAESYINLLAPLITASEMNIVLIAFDWALLRLAKALIPDIQTGFLSIDHAWLTGRPPSKPLWERDNLDFLKDEQRSRWFNQFNPADYQHSFPKAVKAAGGTYWSPYFRDLSKSLVLEAHDLGIKVSSWGADSKEDIDHCLSLGLDSLTTAYIDRAQAGS